MTYEYSWGQLMGYGFFFCSLPEASSLLQLGPVQKLGWGGQIDCRDGTPGHVKISVTTANSYGTVGISYVQLICMYNAAAFSVTQIAAAEFT